MGHPTTISPPDQPASLPVPADLVEPINRLHRAVETTAHKTVEHAMECDRLLLQAKSQLHHGEWAEWLKKNFHGSKRTAQTYMRVAREVPKLKDAKAQRVAHLTLQQAVAAVASNSQKVASREPTEQTQTLKVWEKHNCKNAHQAVARVERDRVEKASRERSRKQRSADTVVDQSPKPSAVCPCCGHAEVDEDGDCTKCHDPWARVDGARTLSETSSDKVAKPVKAERQTELPLEVVYELNTLVRDVAGIFLHRGPRFEPAFNKLDFCEEHPAAVALESIGLAVQDLSGWVNDELNRRDPDETGVEEAAT